MVDTISTSHRFQTQWASLALSYNHTIISRYVEELCTGLSVNTKELFLLWDYLTIESVGPDNTEWYAQVQALSEYFVAFLSNAEAYKTLSME